MVKEQKGKFKLDISSIRLFVEKEIWQMNLKNVKGIQRFVIRLIRTFIIAWRGFKQDNCQLKASALTFYTLLSIVPVIAMFFGVAKGFGFEKKLEAEFKADLSYNQEIISYVFELANSMLENTKGGLIAGLGVALLFWTVMKVLGNIEQAFNDIWEVKQSRTIIRKFSDYLSIMLVTPILAIISGSVAVYISTHVRQITGAEILPEFIGSFFYSLLSLVPILVTTILMTLIYMILPNTKVNLNAGVFGALLTSIMIVLVEWGYLSFQVGVSKYNAIYGGFAALPLFLIWVHTNWTVILLGAELSFAYQNQSKYEFEVESKEISFRFMEILALAVVKSLVHKFVKGEKSLTALQLSEEIQMPAKLVRKVIQELVKAKIISEIVPEGRGETRYQPAIDIAMLDISFVTRKLTESGINELPIEKSESLSDIEQRLQKLEEEMSNSSGNSLIKEIS